MLELSVSNWQSHAHKLFSTGWIEWTIVPISMPSAYVPAHDPPNFTPPLNGLSKFHTAQIMDTNSRSKIKVSKHHRTQSETKSHRAAPAGTICINGWLESIRGTLFMAKLSAFPCKSSNLPRRFSAWGTRGFRWESMLWSSHVSELRMLRRKKKKKISIRRQPIYWATDLNLREWIHLHKKVVPSRRNDFY